MKRRFYANNDTEPGCKKRQRTITSMFNDGGPKFAIKKGFSNSGNRGLPNATMTPGVSP